MNKLITASIAAAGILFTVPSAVAQQYYQHRGYANAPRHYTPAPRHYTPAPRRYVPSNRRHNNNWSPYIAGGLALGILGSGFYSNQNFLSCHSERRNVWDQWGNYIGQQQIKVCN